MIVIVSPHLDDAALSCADHAMAWTRAGEDVVVVNVFNAVGSAGLVSPSMRSSLDAANAGGPADYAALREREDRACMQALGTASLALDFVDAGFRGTDVPDYADLQALRPGRLSRRESDLVDAIAAALAATAAIGAARLVLVPLGIGGHVDHLIARAACERALAPGQVGRYVDMPYGRAPWNWSLPALRKLIGARRSIKAMTAAKRVALAHYRSQTPLLFRRGDPRYPEIVLLPK